MAWGMKVANWGSRVLAMLRRQGVQVAWITGSAAPVVRHRAGRLGIEHVLQGHDDKLPAWQVLIDSL